MIRPRLDLAERNLRTLKDHAVRAGLHTVPVYPQDLSDVLGELDRLRNIVGEPLASTKPLRRLASALGGPAA